jgi:hypothetical protein
MNKLQKPSKPDLMVPGFAVSATDRLRRAVTLGRLSAQLAAARWRAASTAWQVLPRSRPVSAWAAAAWGAAFLHHWCDTLREDCDRRYILDWASELYPTHGHLRADEVAQAEWESMFDEDSLEDDTAA